MFLCFFSIKSAHFKKSTFVFSASGLLAKRKTQKQKQTKWHQKTQPSQ